MGIALRCTRRQQGLQVGHLQVGHLQAVVNTPAPIVGAMIGTIMKTRKISDSRFAIASPANKSRITATTITPSAALTRQARGPPSSRVRKMLRSSVSGSG